MRLRTALLGVAVVAVVAGCGGADEGRSTAGCAEPVAPGAPAEVRAGDELTLSVTGPFECRDGDPTGPEPERPLGDVGVHFFQGDGFPEAVDDVTASGTTYDGTVVVVVPEHAEPGPARISVGGLVGASFTVLP
ncbi:hypothetical protein [Blastococcus sp. SYSU DS0617]